MASGLAFLVQHPLVLQAAWRRVTNWYEQSWTPEPEYAAWRLEPEKHLTELGRALATDKYRPSPFPLIPHPKKGGQLRHYCMPAVRDQVAFTVLGCLLAPLIEGPMPNFSFGSRTYRRAVRRWRPSNEAARFMGMGTPGGPRSAERKKVWDSLPFSLSDSNLYQPYRRAHGLFRRVVHWSAAALTRSQINKGKATDGALQPEDYPWNHLPPFVNQNWWSKRRSGGSKAGYWAHLDLQLAFPSARLPFLEKQLETLLSKELQEDIKKYDRSSWTSRFGRTSWESQEHAANESDEIPEGTLSEFPSDIRDRLLDGEVRTELRRRLIDRLCNVQYAPLEADTQQHPELADLWRPPHADQLLPTGNGSGHPGIPTGLAVSGMLLNAYLHGFDKEMLHRAVQEHGKGKPFAVFRFVDDIVLLAPSREILADTMDAAWQGLAGAKSALATLDPGEIPSNLRVNWKKVEPEPLSNLLSQYLTESWYPKAERKSTKCEGCGIVIPPRDEDPIRRKKKSSFRSWLERRKDSPDIKAEFRKLDREALRRNRLGHFVTYLVERLSALADDGLQNRFGDDAKRRLVELHELVRFALDDLQVKEESRLSFAAGSLARAWLAEESIEGDREQLREIRRSIQHALQRAPAKFQLWRSIIRAALRRPLGGSDDPSADQDRVEARRWLRDLLRLISNGNKGPTSVDSLEHFPDVERQKICWEATPDRAFEPDRTESRLEEISDHYYSFLRASFWRYLAQTLIQLGSTVKGVSEEFPTDQGGSAAPDWSSRSWIFRALPEKELRPAFEWLSRLDEWLLIKPETKSDRLPWWELDAMVLCALAASPRRSLVEYLHDSAQSFYAPEPGPPPHSKLQAPRTLFVLDQNAVTLRVLGRFERVHRPNPPSPNGLPLALLALTLSEPGDQGGLITSLAGYPSREHLANRPELLTSLRLVGTLPAIQAKQMSSELRAHLEGRPWALEQPELLDRESQFYGWHQRYWYLRIHSINTPPSEKKKQESITLHRLLWGSLWQSKRLESAKIDLGTAPKLGLPLRIALKLFLDALNTPSARARTVAHDIPPIWALTDGAREFLAWGRRRQLLGVNVGGSKKVPAGGWIDIRNDLESWEVAPHPVFFVPQVLDLQMSASGYQLWCNTLLFLVACDGDEHFLDSLAHLGAKPLKFSETWEMRDRIHFPTEFWKLLDKIVRQTLLRPRVFAQEAASLKKQVLSFIEKLLKPAITQDDFRWERSDIALNEREGLESPRHISRFSLNGRTKIPKNLGVQPGELGQELCIRMGQIAAIPNWVNYHTRFPLNISRVEIQRIMREVRASMRAINPSNHDERTESRTSQPELVILPEAILPVSEIRELEHLVRKENRAVLCGVLFKALPPVAQGSHGRSRLRWIVNESNLIFPVSNTDDHGPPLVRRFSIRKPMPTHQEYSLAEALTIRDSKGKSSTKWKMLAGQRWYRFVHPRWGDFTVAICSDLMDPSPWWSLRAQTLHIFMCAQNKDVDLFESLSWVRAYENYCNLVSVNHGHYGGSFAWTPKRKQARELARLRGQDLMLLADVTIPVKTLYDAQRLGTKWAIESGVKEWIQETEPDTHYKAPPPTFPSRK